MSLNYTTWFHVELKNVFAESSHYKLCKTEKERDEYVAELCKMIEEMQVINSERPKITIWIDRHVKPNGPLM